jgi:Arc/MetJ family transcription regulator
MRKGRNPNRADITNSLPRLLPAVAPRSLRPVRDGHLISRTIGLIAPGHAHRSAYATLPRRDRAALCKLMCKEAHMATNLAIDPDLLERALEVSGERTKKAAVTRALQEFIARREQARILDLFGSVEIDPAYDYKAERSRG